MSGKLDSGTVRRRINSGEYTVTERKGVRNSSVWDSFKNVCDGKTLDFVGFVQCVRCKSLYSMKEGTGTTNLNKHIKKCGGGSSSSQDDDFSEEVEINTPPMTPNFTPPSSGTRAAPNHQLPQIQTESGAQKENPKRVTRTRIKPPKHVPDHAKSDLIDLCVKFCAIDLRPFNTLNGEGFIHLAQALINIGAEYGQVDAAKLLPHASTVSRRTNAVAEKVKEEFLPEVKEAVKSKCCAFDADIWTDKYTKTAYLTVTAQYITPEYDMKGLVMFTKDFPADEAKTGVNIRRHLVEELADVGIPETDLPNVTFVTDQGSNMKAALSTENRLPCTAHCLATVLRHLFDEKFLSVHAPSIKQSIDTCRNLVTYLKRSGLCRLLEYSVKTMIEVRWDTIFDMLESVCDELPQIIKILRERKEESRLDGWDAELMTELIQFLTEFKKFSKELQSKKVPTLHLVLIRFHDLLTHCTPDDQEDSEEIVNLKLKAAELIKDKIRLHDEHYIAALLCPNVRSLKCLNPELRKRAHDLVLEKMKEMSDLRGSEMDNEESPPAKKRRFSGWEEDEQCLYSPEEELELYFKTGKSSSDDPKDLLPFWKGKASTFPRLAILAKRVFAVPASSGSSERNFSRAGLVVTEKRSSISPHNVNDVLIIHNYYLAIKPDGETTKKFFQLPTT